MVKNCDLGPENAALGHSFTPYGPPSRQITYISSRVNISCLRAKAHLVLRWCLYNKQSSRVPHSCPPFGKTAGLSEQLMSTDEYRDKHIFELNGGFCIFINGSKRPMIFLLMKAINRTVSWDILDTFKSCSML